MKNILIIIFHVMKTETGMNITLKNVESFLGHDHVSYMRNLLHTLVTLRPVIPYIHFPFTILNLIILLLSILLYRNPAISKPSFVFVGNLAFSDSLVTLCSSIVSTAWLSRFMWPKVRHKTKTGVPNLSLLSKIGHGYLKPYIDASPFTIPYDL